MKYAVFARTSGLLKESEFVGMASHKADAVALADHRRAEGCVVSVRRVSQKQAMALAGLETWVRRAVSLDELPGGEFLPPKEGKE